MYPPDFPTPITRSGNSLIQKAKQTQKLPESNKKKEEEKKRKQFMACYQSVSPSALPVFTQVGAETIKVGVEIRRCTGGAAWLA